MDGVTILTTEEFVTDTAFNWRAANISCGVAIIMLIVIGVVISLYTDDWANLFFCGIVGILVGNFIGVFVGGLYGTPVNYANEYKVTISDEVSMNEFMDKYEIIEQDGKIYTVRERD